MKVGLYARVSTERQQERGTISSQLEALRAAAAAEAHEVWFASDFATEVSPFFNLILRGFWGPEPGGPDVGERQAAQASAADAGGVIRHLR